MTWEDEISQWTLAGLTPFGKGMSRPLPVDKLTVPARLQVTEENLLWSWYDEHGEFIPYKELSPDGKMLDAFCRLGNATPQQILRYAQEWGVIGICEHNLPASHNPVPTPLPRQGSFTYCKPLGIHSIRRDWAYEPLETWRHFARQARGLLNIAAQLHQSQLGHPDDWNTVYEWTEDAGKWLKEESRTIEEQQRRLQVEQWTLANTVNEWLVLGNVRPLFQWPSDKPAFVSIGHRLFGNIAVQLMSAVSRTDSLALCSACGTPYAPSRQPRDGEMHYCQNCGRRAANRVAARRYRNKDKN